MRKLKAGFLAVAGVAIGVLTVRRLRKRGGSDDVAAAEEDIRSEAEAAVDHAGSAVDHARVAGAKTIEAIETEIDQRSADEDEPETTTPGGRLRRVGKGWIRR